MLQGELAILTLNISSSYVDHRIFLTKQFPGSVKTGARIFHKNLETAVYEMLLGTQHGVLSVIA